MFLGLFRKTETATTNATPHSLTVNAIKTIKAFQQGHELATIERPAYKTLRELKVQNSMANGAQKNNEHYAKLLAKIEALQPKAAAPR